MSYRHACTLLAVALLVAAIPTPPVAADVIVLRDGEVIPKSVQLPAGEVPGDDDLEKSKGSTVDLAYDVVKAGGKDVPAALVADVYLLAARRNNSYNEGEVRAESGFWSDAAESFQAAAEELTGSAKQQALYKNALCLANAGDVEGTLAAVDALLTEFPKSYWFGPAQQKRALIFAMKGQTDDAVAALQKVTSAPGMNARDLFEAEYTKLWLTKMMTARTKEDIAGAEKAFRDLADAIDKHPKGRQEAADQRIKAMARVGKTLALQNRAAEGRKILEDALAGATSRTDRGALAAVHAGMGDSLFLLAKQALEGGKRDEAKDLSEKAAMHYLRVTLLYSGSADRSDMFNATQNVARVFRNLFTLSGEKDCEVAQRAYEHFRQAVDMLDPGEEKRTLVREGKALKDAMDRACGTGAPAAAGAPAPGEPGESIGETR